MPANVFTESVAEEAALDWPRELACPALPGEHAELGEMRVLYAERIAASYA